MNKENIQIDNQILRMLIRIKLMLHHALEHSNKNSEIDAFISFLGLDNVVENILNIIVSFLDLDDKLRSNKNYSDMADYASQINNILKSEYDLKLPYLAEIKLLRKTRNLIQHNLINPGIELDRFVKITRRFFEYCLTEIFNLTENDINDFLLIENEDVKNHLKEAKDSLQKNEYLKSIVASRDAFENTWFEIIKSSEINLSSLAADIEAKKMSMFYAEYFYRIKKELILVKLGVDSKIFEKFDSYLDHIPSEFRANKSSMHTVMQREWNTEDATFCYDFVFDFVIKYQNSLNQPLYKIKHESNHSSQETYGNINISDGSEGKLSYLYLEKFKSHEMQLLYVNEKLKDKLGKLVLEKKYVFEKRGFRDKSLEFIIKYKTILHNISFELTTNNPQRWQIMMWFEYVPFSWYRTEYSNGMKIKESVNINTVSLKRFKEEFGWIISNNKAIKIINLRKALGKIKSVSDLKKIKELTEDEIEWITRYSHS